MIQRKYLPAENEVTLQKDELYYKSADRSIYSELPKVHHYIARLAAHIRDSQALVMGCTRAGPLLDKFDVRGVKRLGPVAHEKVNKFKTPTQVLRQIHKDNREREKSSLRDLGQMEHQHGLNIYKSMERWYNDPKRPLTVHSEVLVLEHFKNNTGIKFAHDDAYVACSKAACFCCEIYFRHRQNTPSQQPTHGKMYIGWSPPVTVPPGFRYHNLKYDLLKRILQDISSSILVQIHEKSMSMPDHTDSISEISSSSTATVTSGQSSLRIDHLSIDDGLQDTYY